MSLSPEQKSPTNQDLTEELVACPSCDSDRLKQLPAPSHWIDAEHFAGVKDALRLSKCKACGLVVVSPRPGLDLLRSFYDKPGYHCHDLQFDSAEESYAKARFSIIEKYSRKGVLLDYGCGAGNMLKAALARGWSRACGIEIGEKARNALRKKGFEVYEDLRGAASLRGQVDAVTMIQVMEHLVEPGAVLKAVSEMLRPGGIFVVEVPNAGSLRAQIAGSMIAGIFPRPVQRYQAFPIHLYHFEAPQLKALLAKYGFQIITLQTLGLGVEELWAQPSNTAAAKAPSELSSGGPPVPATSKSFVVSSMKTAIKRTMSTLRWGEQLIAVCVKGS